VNKTTKGGRKVGVVARNKSIKVRPKREAVKVDAPLQRIRKRPTEGVRRRVVVGFSDRSVWRKPELRIGISGWNYPPWRGGTFYPKGWPKKRELEYASRQVNSIEINGSFYSLQRPESYHTWYNAAPEGFLFSVKGSRFITHLKRLKNVETPLANFFASGVLRLREKLGPILWQLPPRFVYDRAKLESFFRLLPRTTSAAAALARNHDDRLDGRAWTKSDRVRPLRHALEVRHDSFMVEEFVDLLRKHDIALVVADTAGKWPFMEDVTSDFVYVRLHGDEELYVSGYNNAALQLWERKIRVWARGDTPTDAKLTAPRHSRRGSPRDIFVYFDNDAKVRAPFDAKSLAHHLALGPAPSQVPDQASIKLPSRASSSVDRRWQISAHGSSH